MKEFVFQLLLVGVWLDSGDEAKRNQLIILRFAP
jgi:hypothetical protein